MRQVRPSTLDEWLAHEAPRLRNVSYNGYTAFIRQLFDIAVKDRVIAVSPASQLRVPWKKPQAVRRIIPTVAQFEAIVASICAQQYADTAQVAGDFIEFLGLAGLGQAEASSLKWGDIDWTKNRLHIRRHKTDTHFYVPIYDHLRPLLERLRKEGRARVSANALVFGIKDAKKALASACQRLGLPAFSQRNLRQCLIVRLMRAGVNVKLIAKWQGHQDGGQLIMDTYTEALGSDDDECSQLAKIGGGVPPALPSGYDVDGSTSGAMKGPKKSHVLPPAPADPAHPPATAAVNPYTKGDKVKTVCKGAEVEAEVITVYKGRSSGAYAGRGTAVQDGQNGAAYGRAAYPVGTSR